MASYLNPAPGQTITTATSVCVGEPVTLSITGTNFTSVTGTSAPYLVCITGDNSLDITGTNFVIGYNWHVPGAIKNYLPLDSGGNPVINPVIQLSSSDTTASSLTVYYPVVPESGTSSTPLTSGTAIVSCDLTLITGGTMTVSGSLNVVAPQCTISSVTMNPVGKSQSASNSVTEDMFLGADVSMLTPTNGINIFYTVQPTSPFLSGTAICAQIIESSTMTQAGSPYTITNALDKSFPYALDAQNPGHFMGDSPAVRGVTEAASPTSIRETYQSYMMYLPNIPNAIYVPLKCVTWQWSGTLTYSAPFWTLSGTNYGNDGGMNAYHEPNWTTIWTRTYP